MGAAAMGQCYEDAQQAAAAVCQLAYPLAGIAPEGTVLVSCLSASAGEEPELTLLRATSWDGNYLVNVPVVAPACDPLTFASGTGPLAISTADGVLLGGAIASVWGIAWAWKALLRALRTDEN